MVTILQYEIGVVGPYQIHMPTNADILGVQIKGEPVGPTGEHCVVLLLVGVETTAPSAMRKIHVVYSGMEIHEDNIHPSMKIYPISESYIGSAQCDGMTYHYLDGGYVE